MHKICTLPLDPRLIQEQVRQAEEKKKQSEKKKKDRVPFTAHRKEQLEQSLAKYTLVYLTPRQIRVEGFLDIYPVGRRFCLVRSNTWGNYEEGKEKELVEKYILHASSPVYHQKRTVTLPEFSIPEGYVGKYVDLLGRS